MARWRCNACRGTYTDTQADGSTYFHSCPPYHADQAGTLIPIVNPRNENLALAPNGEPLGIISAGAGVTPLDGQPEPEPAWIAIIKPLVRL
jgi:hypothetical protein